MLLGDLRTACITVEAFLNKSLKLDEIRVHGMGCDEMVLDGVDYRSFGYSSSLSTYEGQTFIPSSAAMVHFSALPFFFSERGAVA